MCKPRTVRPVRLASAITMIMRDENSYAFLQLVNEKEFLERDAPLFPGRASPVTTRTTNYIRGDMIRYHQTCLNRHQTDALLSYQVWQNNGDFESISRQMGYRFRMTTSNVPKRVKLGSTFPMNFTIVNDGFGSLYNSRPVEIKLSHQRTGQIFTLRLSGSPTLNQDPRYWQPGKTYTVSVYGGIPSPGRYRVGLYLPDAAPKLYNRTEYAIRLANTKLWHDNGMNDLLQTGSSKKI
jgi:Domain of unknown function (DUF4832)